ncbi:molybdopterin-dependent oxidoreductase [Conexibacter stalactiti]|uniref:Molybdopterin-dependent oxidoreductase n=1 Tax=Conexibacter stalactiti TaxID=1940611 RepID=A0ABU4HL21_9ACTN|nr:molybdopterin-dependent oxidoreductase [Conexibacter stalactiti]MDW5593998.1 molybdopterin-dependent oxidoreductase [Conexibacter stalactiti]MEC5034640.1 molybdopterin-dependent oxidoreductase [Conexibacter stalactiti]
MGGGDEQTVWQQSACILCECNCGIEVQLDGRRLARIRGDRAHPASQGYTCNKALRLDHYQNGRDRLTSPLRRTADGSYEPIDWETAITEIAAGLSAVRDEHGGESIFYYGGGGQGNHLGGAYSRAVLATLGNRYRSSALAQEKMGEGFVDAHLYGGHTRGDFEHAEVALFVGKNPWQSQSFPRARIVLKELSSDPERALIVLDPVVTETARIADVHLQVRPGGDAWCLAALLGVLVQEGLTDSAFLDERTTGAEAVLQALRAIPVADFARRAGVPLEQVETAARRIGRAESVATFEDLGIQQGPNSVLCSYLNKLVWLLRGSFGKPGAMHLHSWMAPLARYKIDSATTPVSGAPIVGGLVPCNAIPDEILTDHPQRLRAMIVESANPAHSLADSGRWREALRALDLVVVIDVALSETARQADYVLPAASQFEKWEATFFNLEFPRNTFQLRAPLLDPLPGTLPEPEIWARIMRALDVIPETTLAPLRAAAQAGRLEFATAFLTAAGGDPRLAAAAPFVLYETLGPTLPDGAQAAAALWGLAHRCAMTYPDAVRGAGHEGEGPALGEALFDALLTGRSGITFTLDDYEDAWRYVRTADGRIALEIPELLDELRALDASAPGWTSDEFPFVLSAGERRASTANTIIRDPAWRKRDAQGALRIAPADAERLGLLGDGARARITTATGAVETPVEVNAAMQPGHVSLPNGLGLDYPGDDGRPVTTGVALNELTSLTWRDPRALTPWHKHVPARVEAVAG